MQASLASARSRLCAAVQQEQGSSDGCPTCGQSLAPRSTVHDEEVWRRGCGTRGGERKHSFGPCLLDGVAEATLVIHANLNPGDGLALGHPGEELLGDLGEQGAGEDVVDVAGAALDLLAAAGDVLDRGRRRR